MAVHGRIAWGDSAKNISPSDRLGAVRGVRPGWIRVEHARLDVYRIAALQNSHSELSRFRNKGAGRENIIPFMGQLPDLHCDKIAS
jgi:hypothetical protein